MTGPWGLQSVRPCQHKLSMLSSLAVSRLGSSVTGDGCKSQWMGLEVGSVARTSVYAQWLGPVVTQQLRIFQGRSARTHVLPHRFDNFFFFLGFIREISIMNL